MDTPVVHRKASVDQHADTTDGDHAVAVNRAQTDAAEEGSPDRHWSTRQCWSPQAESLSAAAERLVRTSTPAETRGRQSRSFEGGQEMCPVEQT